MNRALRRLLSWRCTPVHPECGFTLIEVLTALAIVAILCALAWPGYASIMQRAQRHDARLALLRLQHLQENHYATHLRYAARLGRTADADTLIGTELSDDGFYRLSLARTDDAQGYIATAQAREDAAQFRDRACRQLTVDEKGRRRSADAAGRWSEDDPHRCWG